MKLILLTTILFLLGSCDIQSKRRNVTSDNGSTYNVRVIDGCEYNKKILKK